MMKSNGFTLIETMVALAILMTLTTVGIPTLLDFIVRMRVDNEISEINRLLFVARNSSINTHQFTTLCPLNKENKCHNQWHKELSVFIDNNNNKTFEPAIGETILSTKSAIKDKDILQYGNTRIGLTYAANGHLAGWGQNATFKYCPYNNLVRSRGIVVALSGRTYKSKLDKKSGKDKTRSGKYIVCQ